MLEGPRSVPQPSDAAPSPPRPTQEAVGEGGGLEPWDDAVLRHTDAPHDVMERYDSYTSKRRSQKGEGAVYRSRVGGGRKANDPLMRALLRWRAGKTLERIGYT